MAAWIVRPALKGQTLATGKEGASGVVIYAPSPQKALELGAERLGVPASRLEVIETDNRASFAVGGDDLSPEEMEQLRKDAFSGGVEVVGSWEPI